MKRLLVTGRSGFVGHTLSSMLEVEDGLGGWRVAPVAVEFRIEDPAATHQLVAAANPDAVIHLAARSFVPDSFQDPEGTLRVNLHGTLNLLESLDRHGFNGTMLYVSSGDVYGLVPESELPISELRLPAPRSPYAVSKVAAEALCYQWSLARNFRVVIARPFNHIGPGQSDRFVVSDLTHQLARIVVRGEEPVLKLGDIDVTRDFTDVRDVVRAYFALLENGANGYVYNVCTGVERSVRSIIEELQRLTGLTVVVELDSARIRNQEQRRVAGNPTRLRQATGWRPQCPLSQSLQSMFEYWIEIERNA